MMTQVLSFVVGREEYAIDILKVHEIKSFTPVTPVPNSPGHVRGVMNLRGAVVPVVDLRVRFGVVSVDNKFTVIILAAAAGKVVGFVVDAVSDVVELAPDAIVPPPQISGHLAFLQGIARVDERLLGILDSDTVGNLGDA